MTGTVHVQCTPSVHAYIALLVHVLRTGTRVLVLVLPYFGTLSVHVPVLVLRYISSEKSILYSVRHRHWSSNNSLRYDFGTGILMFIYKPRGAYNRHVTVEIANPEFSDHERISQFS